MPVAPQRSAAMNLFLFLAPSGRQVSAWRSPKSRIEELYGLELPMSMVRQAEGAKLDAVFIPEGGVMGTDGMHPFPCPYEPFTLMGALAAATSQIGLIGTGSTSFLTPYHLARFMASIDHLSRGRASWNVVTSTGGNECFGVELPPPDERYRRAHEFMEVTYALWDGWADDAVLNDRANTRWAASERVRPARHHGEYFDVEGSLLMPRSPQGRPVIVQAGQSRPGIEFAARHAEVVFTAQTDLAAAKEHYARLKTLASQYGRDPEHIRVLPGLCPILGCTEADAAAFDALLGTLVDVRSGLEGLSVVLGGVQLDDLDLDRPIPPERLLSPDDAPDAAWATSRYRNFHAMAVEGLSLRQMMTRREQGLGHGVVVGTAAQVADHMQRWVQERACDGFALTPVTVPEGLDQICDALVPELQRRGLFHSDYPGSTLRANLGLPRPDGGAGQPTSG